MTGSNQLMEFLNLGASTYAVELSAALLVVLLATLTRHYLRTPPVNRTSVETRPEIPKSSTDTAEQKGPSVAVVGITKGPRLDAPLGATRQSLVGRLRGLFSRADSGEAELFAGIERTLISADVGVAATEFLISDLKSKLAAETLKLQAAELETELRRLLGQMLASSENPKIVLQTPHVILLVGVNGVGKTTSIAKLAALYQRQGRRVLLAAADTFRAAAVEQLEVWGERLGIPVVTGAENAKPSTVAYSAIKRAQAENFDILLIDTAGRLHNRTNLMQELEAVVSIIAREYPGAPHETYLVLDASTGQNAVQQAREFQTRAAVTGLVMTKLDGTPKGGSLIAIAHELALPIRYIGVGEGLEDLREFNVSEFIEALFAPTVEELPESEPSTHAKVRRTRRG